MVSPLRQFSYNLIHHTEEELEKHALPKTNLDSKSLAFILKAQKKINSYIIDFQNIANPTVRSAVEEQQVAELQGKCMTEILSDIPVQDETINELLSVKVLETFAIHNRNLNFNWFNPVESA